LICSYCGIIHGQNNLVSINRNIYNKNEEKLRKRSGPFITILNGPLYSLTNFDPYVANNISCYRRLARRDKWYRSQEDRTLSYTLVHIKRISSKLNIPKHVQVYCVKLYNEARKRSLIIGKSLNNTIISSIYLSCRIHGIPMFIDEIIKESGWKNEGIKRHIIYLVKELNLKLPMIDMAKIVMKCINLLGLNNKIEKEALDLWGRLPFHIINGKDPKGVVSAVIFIVAKKNGTKLVKFEMERKIGTTATTIRNHLAKIELFLK
jgi:transcription initiation factor TFIIIB Brf1 subunit/transcription initiation factor TFIIB